MEISWSQMRERQIAVQIERDARDSTAKRISEKVEKMYRRAPRRDWRKLRRMKPDEIEERLDI